MKKIAKKKRRGRPRSANPMVRMPEMMVRPEQLDAYRAASERAGKTFSAWVRDVLDRAS